MRLCSKEQPGNVAGLIGYVFEISSKTFAFRHSRNTFPPCCIIFLRCPVYLSHHDRGKTSYRTYLLVPTTLERFISPSCRGAISFTTVLFGITSIPARITVYGKTNIFSFDTMVFIATILRLPAQSGYPNDIVTSISTYFINNRLKILLHIDEASITVTTIFTVCTFYMNGFISQLEHNPGIILDNSILRYNVPYFQQKLLIRISQLYT